MIDGTSQMSSRALMIVSATLVQLENRLWRIHPTAPVVAAGAGSASATAART